MESQRQYEEKIIFCLCCLFILFGCETKVNPKKIVYDTSQIKNGDVIYRLGNGFFSNFIRDFSEKDKRFSHVGIVYKTDKNDTFFVIHAEEDDMSNLKGIKKTPVSEFLEDAQDWAVYRLKSDNVTQKNISEQALGYFKKQMPFDQAFDAQDSTAFYCAELVAHCINNTLGKEIIKPNTVKKNQSFIAIDDTYLIDTMALVMKNIATH